MNDWDSIEWIFFLIVVGGIIAGLGGAGYGAWVHSQDIKDQSECRRTGGSVMHMPFPNPTSDWKCVGAGSER
jgi:hypothetical protein